MRFKDGVDARLTAEIIPVLLDAERIWTEHGRAEGVTITSGRDGRHKVGSLHYTGNAVDLRTRYWSETEKHAVSVELQAVLGLDYDVVVERDHIHVEYDPKPRSA